MADPFTLAVVGLTMASGATTAIGNFQGKKRQESVAKRNADVARMQADQIGASMSEDLADTLANIDAIRSSSGADPLSPTSMAVKAEHTRRGGRNRRRAVDDKNSQAVMSDADADFFNSSANFGLFADTLSTLTKTAKATQ